MVSKHKMFSQYCRIGEGSRYLDLALNITPKFQWPLLNKLGKSSGCEYISWGSFSRSQSHICSHPSLWKVGKFRPPFCSPPLPPPGHWANVHLTDLWWSLTPAHTEYLRVVQSVREFPNILQGNYHFQHCPTSYSLT